jgi:hypothetical protein
MAQFLREERMAPMRDFEMCRYRRGYSIGFANSRSAFKSNFHGQNALQRWSFSTVTGVRKNSISVFRSVPALAL